MSSSQQVIALLRERYPKESYALITEVGNATGHATNRHADAIAMSLWPSRGLEIMGFEVKVSRSDWVSELKNPAKADAIARYCDKWWLAVSDAKIVHPGELPLNWGLLAIEKGKLKCLTEAKLNEDVQFDRKFLGAVMRKVQAQCLGEAELEAARQKGYQEGRTAKASDDTYQMDRVKTDLQRLTENVETFEKASGVFIRNSWNAGQIGEAVRMVQAGVHLRQMKEMERIHESCNRVGATIAEELLKLRQTDLTLAGTSIQS